MAPPMVGPTGPRIAAISRRWSPVLQRARQAQAQQSSGADSDAGPEPQELVRWRLWRGTCPVLRGLAGLAAHYGRWGRRA